MSLTLVSISFIAKEQNTTEKRLFQKTEPKLNFKKFYRILLDFMFPYHISYTLKYLPSEEIIKVFNMHANLELI